MHRWHTEGCRAPDVQVLADKTPYWPYCITCGQAPRVADLIAKNTSTSAVPRIPPDLPLGELNLWWPRSVRYCASAAPSPSSSSVRISQLSSTTEVESSAPSILVDSPYPLTLGIDKFRLISLAAVPSPDYPIHLLLEVYDLKNCPEYETVSYTWAGEDGDATLCKPVYVGPYWDIMLQTRNCWEMLRFMRPNRSTRLIWVDAISINQSNLQERNMQVANMRAIYSACSRVVIYLGPDIAIPLHDKYPRRRRLHELESGAVKPNFFPSRQSGGGYEKPPSPGTPPHKLSDILRRRYFSRVWVIQELLLPQNVIIRVGDVDFWADASMTSHFSSKLPHWKWDSTPAAWVQHMSKGTESVNDLIELLSLTSLSRATDPRDRIFGLLGIMPHTTITDLNGEGLLTGNQTDFQADYSMSCQHVFIGLFAHCLINLNQSDMLYHASGISSNLLHYPSWAPDWTSRVTWKFMFQPPNLTSEMVFDELRTLISRGYRCGKTYQQPIAERRYELCELRGPGKPLIMQKRHWNKSAYIDASSGSLGLYLTQYMYLNKKLERIGGLKKFHIFATHYQNVSVYLVSEYRIDRILAEDDKAELFILNRDDRSFIYLLVRLEYNENGEEMHSLVCACPFVFVQVPADLPTTIVPQIRDIPLERLQFSVYDFIQVFDRDLNELLCQNYQYIGRMKALFPGLKTVRHVFPVLRLLYEQEEEMRGMDEKKRSGGGTAENIKNVAFANALVGCINRRHKPRVSGDFIMITISTARKDFSEIYINKRNWLDRHVASEEMLWEYRLYGTEDEWALPVVSQFNYTNLFPSKKETFIDIRFKIDDARDLIPKATDFPWLFQTIRKFSLHINETGDSLWALFTHEVNWEYHFRGCPHLGHRNPEVFNIYNDIEVDGSTFMVNLV